MSGALARAQRFGSMRRPVRASANMQVNSPAGWMTDPRRGPIPWTSDVADPGAVWWIGNSVEDGRSPIGPHGPWSQPGGLPAAVERATALVVGPLVSLPWRLYRGTWRDSAGAESLPPRLWMVDPMLLGNVPGVGGSAFPAYRRRPGTSVWGEWLRHALWFGRGWVTFAETGDPGPGDPYSEPVPGTVLNLAPSMVEDTDDGWRIGDDTEGVDVDADGRYRIGGRTWRLLCLREPLGDGTGVFGRHATDLGLAVHVRGYASGTFRSGIPSGYLKSTATAPLTQQDADTLKSRWMEANGGDRRSVAVLSSTVDFTAISVKPIDAQLVGVDDMVLRMVAHAFTLSGRSLDSGASAGNSYANIQDERHDRVDDSVMPWKRVLEDTVSSVLPYGTWHEVEMRGYLETDTAKRTAYYQAMHGMGAMDVGEIRRLERMPPLPEQPQTQPEPEPALPVGGGSDAAA